MSLIYAVRDAATSTEAESRSKSTQTPVDSDAQTEISMVSVWDCADHVSGVQCRVGLTMAAGMYPLLQLIGRRPPLLPLREPASLSGDQSDGWFCFPSLQTMLQLSLPVSPSGESIQSEYTNTQSPTLSRRCSSVAQQDVPVVEEESSVQRHTHKEQLSTEEQEPPSPPTDQVCC